MKLGLCAAVLFLSILSPQDAPSWQTEKHKNFALHFSELNKEERSAYVNYLNTGLVTVDRYFGQKMQEYFNVFIHPDRHSLDSTWQKDWKVPDFKSECWMVASGVAGKLDILRPSLWDSIACEHSYSNTNEVQKLVTHELVHVYHGQVNASPDFSDLSGIDWFVEGLATFVSGQLDTLRIADVKEAIRQKNIPASLDKFWTGKLKYGLSGSMVKYIEWKYGKDKLKALLVHNNVSGIYKTLHCTEQDLIEGWRNYMMNY